MITRPVKHEFERQLLNGDITDIEKYFEDRRYIAERYILAKHGINVDQTLRMDGYEAIIRLIRDGVLKERYAEWKDHPNKDVRLELAMHGWYPEHYIHDVEPDIREAVMEIHLELGLERTFDDADRDVFRGLLSHQTRPNIDILREYVETVAPDYEQDHLTKAFKLKYEAMTTEPSPIEATMTPVQLYETGSPLWALGYDADTIWKIILYAKYFANQNEKDFVTAMFEFVDAKLTTDGELYATDMVSIHQQMIHARMS